MCYAELLFVLRNQTKNIQRNVCRCGSKLQHIKYIQQINIYIYHDIKDESIEYIYIYIGKYKSIKRRKIEYAKTNLKKKENIKNCKKIFPRRKKKKERERIIQKMKLDHFSK